MYEIPLIGFFIAIGILLMVKTTVQRLQAEVMQIPVRVLGKQYSYINLKSKEINELIPLNLIDSKKRYVLVMTASCSACYERMEELHETLNQSECEQVLVLLLEDERAERFVALYGKQFSIAILHKNDWGEFSKVILPCYLEIDDRRTIREASEDIGRMVSSLKGGE